MSNTVIINLLSAVPQKDIEAVMINRSVDDFISQYQAFTNEHIESYTILSSKVAENYFITINKIHKGNVISIPVPPEKIDIGDRDTLEWIFLEIKKRVNPIVDNWILVCWGHGMGFSLFNLITTSDKFFSNFKFNLLLSNNGDDPDIKKVWNEGLVTRVLKHDIYLSDNEKDEKKGVTALTMNELASTLRKVNLNFDLIVMDNCYMQNIDTLYALGGSTRYIISAQTAIPWQSFLYSAFDTLSAKIDDTFCIDFCNGSLNKLNFLEKVVSEADRVWYQNITFSCLNTSMIKNFTDKLEDILTYIYDNYKIPSLSQPLVNALYNGFDLSQLGFKKNESLSLIDLPNFLNKLKAELNSNDHPVLVQVITEFESIFGNMLKTNISTPLLKNKSSGLSICFPLMHELLDKHIYYHFFLKDMAQVKSQFAKTTNWGRFINVFLKSLPF